MASYASDSMCHEVLYFFNSFSNLIQLFSRIGDEWKPDGYPTLSPTLSPSLSPIKSPKKVQPVATGSPMASPVWKGEEPLFREQINPKLLLLF